MQFRKSDFDAEEREFVSRVKLPACPEIGLLYSAREGILPDNQAQAVQAHLASCEVCRTLVTDLEEIEFGNPTAIDAANTRNRIRHAASGAFESTNLRVRPARRWVVPAFALAACLLLAFVFMRSHKNEITPAATPSQEAQARPIPDVPLDRLPIHLDPSALLATRGAGNAGPGTELAKALVPYQKGDYFTAVQRLESLAQKYPQDATVALYLGISELFLDRNADAVRDLESARKLNEGSRLADSQWYLGIADLRLKNVSAAAQLFHDLCEGKTGYSERACAIESQLK